MDIHDPNTWTSSVVSNNTSACLGVLKDINSQVIDLVRRKNYNAAVAGLDRILNGLATMHNGTNGDYHSHMSMFSWAEAEIVAFGTDAPESKRKEVALKLFEDARDFSKSSSNKEMLTSIINSFKSGKSLVQLKAEYDSDFPDSIVDILQNMNSQLSKTTSSSGTGKSGRSGGCYVATAVYGSYDCPEVWTLRRYRDDTLAETWYGRAFIHTYYAISPTLVKWFGHTEWFKKMWKGKLDRIVANLHANGVESTPYNDKKW